MASFDEARDALLRTIRRVFPTAKPVRRWAGIETWGAPRPAAAVKHASTGTYDPKVTVIGIADRKVGPTVYFLDPGDYHALETHRTLLEQAGFKLGRSCIMHTRKGPLPVEALETLFRVVKTRDERAAAEARATEPKAKASRPAVRRAPRKTAAAQDEGADAVEAYLARLPADQRAALERLRKQVLAVVPTATQRIAYGIPTFVHHGNLVHMAAFRRHCSFFPGSAGVTRALQEELRGHETRKGTIQFTPEKPLPAALVKRIVKLRVAENEARAAKAARPKRAKKATGGATRTPRAAPARSR